MVRPCSASNSNTRLGITFPCLVPCVAGTGALPQPPCLAGTISIVSPSLEDQLPFPLYYWTVCYSPSQLDFCFHPWQDEPTAQGGHYLASHVSNGFSTSGFSNRTELMNDCLIREVSPNTKLAGTWTHHYPTFNDKSIYCHRSFCFTIWPNPIFEPISAILIERLNCRHPKTWSLVLDLRHVKVCTLRPRAKWP